MNEYDLIIIGGGINGCGIAADASLRNLSVLLCEQNDLASGTSSTSTKLIHGGLRYLENYHFKLVKKALDERQILQSIAPHLIKPQRFVLPLTANTRSRYLIRSGLFLYDHLSRKNRLPKTQFHRRNTSTYLDPLRPEINKAYSYYDCTANDSRLTVSNAIQARNHGANILTQTQCIAIEYQHQRAILTLCDKNNNTQKVLAKSIINATGPWVNRIDNLLGVDSPYRITLVKGSHIVTKKLYSGKQGYLLQNSDARVLFTIPYYGMTLIGTTEIAHPNITESVAISSGETEYLLNAVNTHFKQNISAQDIIHSWSGVRPLLSAKNTSLKTINRDYKIHLNTQSIPVISIYGGKITTFRTLALQAVNRLAPFFQHMSACKTEEMLLPSYAHHTHDFQHYQRYAASKYKWLKPELLFRYLSYYGTMTEKLLENCTHRKHLGEYFNHSLYAQEIDYLVQCEWAKTSEDILWRRTQLGYYFTENDTEKLMQYLRNTHKI